MYRLHNNKNWDNLAAFPSSLKESHDAENFIDSGSSLVYYVELVEFGIITGSSYSMKCCIEIRNLEDRCSLISWLESKKQITLKYSASPDMTSVLRLST